MTKRFLYRVAAISFILIVLAQFIRVDRSVPEFNLRDDFIILESVPDQFSQVLKSACYNCHSYQTRYPWYSQVAPVSWWLQNHINHAREHLNFSIWGTYDQETQKHNLEECEEEVSEGFMPLPSYTWLHSEARLTDEERKMLADWFSEMYKNH